MRQFTISKLLIAFLMMLCCGTAMASDFVTVDGFKFVVDTDKGEAMLLANAYSGDIVVPEKVSYNGKDFPVTVLGPNCFGSGVTNVSIPNSVKSFREKCFYFSKIKSIDIPNSVLSFGSECFANSSLNEIHLPESITTLSYGCFKGTALKEVDIPTSVVELGSSCFSGCTKLEKIIIPKSVSFIPSDCFRGTGLKEVIIPTSVQRIRDYAFSGCTRLEKIVLPEGLLLIGEYSFYNCSSLQEIELPSSLVGGNNFTFTGCKELKKYVCKAATPPYMIWGDDYSKLAECILYVPQKSVELYKQNGYWKGFGIIKAIEGVFEEATSCSTPTISYTSGNLSFESSTPGAEYHYTINDADVATDKYNTDGKVLLNGKLDISVYATADGYKASDKATATLYWLYADGDDDANNINLVKTRGVMVTTDSDITISGLNDGEVVTFYSVNGVNLGSAKAVQGVLHFARPNESIVIAKIKGNDLKIAIR